MTRQATMLRLRLLLSVRCRRWFMWRARQSQWSRMRTTKWRLPHGLRFHVLKHLSPVLRTAENVTELTMGMHTTRVSERGRVKGRILERVTRGCR